MKVSGILILSFYTFDTSNKCENIEQSSKLFKISGELNVS